MKKIILAVPALVFGMAACTPAPVVDPPIDVTSCATEISSANGNNVISSSTAWINSDRGCDYLVKSNVSVNASLNIEAGTVIVFEGGIGMNVASGGTLTALGTAAKTIVFRGKTESAGFWKGIAIDSTTNNQMAFTTVKHAGSAAAQLGAVYVSGGRLALTDSVINTNLQYGLYSSTNTSDLTGFARNTFFANGKSGVNVYLPQLKSLDAASKYQSSGQNNEAPNTDPWVNVKGGNLPAADVTTIAPTTYRVEGTFETFGTLTISPSTTIMFAAGGAFRVSGGGQLTAIGTFGQPIAFRGQNETAGFWDGVIIGSSTNNQMAFVTVKDTGANASIPAAIYLTDARLALSDSRIANNSRYGLVVAAGTSDLTSFARNTFSGTALSGVKIVAQQLKYLDTATNYHGTGAGNTPNGQAHIEIAASNLVAADVISVIPQTYRVLAGFGVSGALTIQPGVILEFASGANLNVGATGSLVAIGASTNRIQFKGATASAGFWEGITLTSGNINNRLEFVDVSHTGSNGAKPGAVFMNGASKLSIKDSSFRDNTAYGIYRDSAGSTLTNISGNVFSNNPSGDIRNP
jgi:hypothetical protein